MDNFNVWRCNVLSISNDQTSESKLSDCVNAHLAHIGEFWTLQAPPRKVDPSVFCSQQCLRVQDLCHIA